MKSENEATCRLDELCTLLAKAVESLQFNLFDASAYHPSVNRDYRLDVVMVDLQQGRIGVWVSPLFGDILWIRINTAYPTYIPIGRIVGGEMEAIPSFLARVIHRSLIRQMLKRDSHG